MQNGTVPDVLLKDELPHVNTEKNAVTEQIEPPLIQTDAASEKQTNIDSINMDNRAVSTETNTTTEDLPTDNNNMQNEQLVNTDNNSNKNVPTSESTHH